ncbi:carbohydrate sulfotransferase 15-like [Babylonia areolata]|uniref:carbohydrate sulfotransferase 15-like n=1 Tax=Babylonia areolata TaxID=304850 RepID=UPI003FD6493D
MRGASLSRMKPTWVAVLLVSVTAGLCLLCVYSGHLTRTPFTPSIFAARMAVQQSTGTQSGAQSGAHSRAHSRAHSSEDRSPKWWTEAWRRSAVWEHRHSFVGDCPLFPPCLSSHSSWKGYPFVEPQRYVNSSKNPCWYEKGVRGRALRCVPYFYLAGVAKCGTTDLAKRIRRHPQVFEGTMKEYHWWERFRFGDFDEEDLEESLDFQGGMTFEQYTDKIAGKDIDKLQQELKENGSSVRIFGDFSPSYLWDPRNWYVLQGNENCSEPRVTVTHHIRHVFPPAKVILTLRHPTPRLYSRFVSRTTRVPELRRATPEDFHTYVLEGIQIYERCFAQFSVRQCAYNVSVYKEAKVRLVEGMYPVFLADWLRVWPRDSVLVLRYEDYGGHEGERLAEIFRFLGLDPLDEDAMSHVLSFDAVNSGSEEYNRLGPMLPATHQALDTFYRPFVLHLAHLLHDPRFLWADVTP